MDYPHDGPNVEFLPHAQAFLNTQTIEVQGEVTAIASWLYGSPKVDRDQKFLVPGPWVGGVRQYGRAYVDDNYAIRYDFDAEADPPLLRVPRCPFRAVSYGSKAAPGPEANRRQARPGRSERPDEAASQRPGDGGRTETRHAQACAEPDGSPGAALAFFVGPAVSWSEDTAQ